MQYLTKNAEIKEVIAKLATAKTLWLDTETAHWNTPEPKISLIQALAEPEDLTGDCAYIIDVLNKPDLVEEFISQVMENPEIEKVFHNAKYDLKFLGKERAKNVTCTYKIARKRKRDRLQVPNLQLKTLAEHLCHFSNVDKAEQGSDWGQRPLTPKQLQYAKMDVVYLAQVHRRLLEIIDIDRANNIFNMPKNGNNHFTPTPTKVRVAFECPRLFYLHQHFGGNTLFLPKDATTGIGKAFHQLADKFVNLAQRSPEFKTLFEPAAEHIKVEEIAWQMQQLFYRMAFYPYLNQQDQSLAPALLQIWQGLKGIIRRWAELLVVNRRYCSGETVISKTFVTQSRKLEHYFNLPDGTQQRVAGEFDCLIYNCELERLCVVEFKTYQPEDTAAQLAQVSLYSYMLKEKQNVPVDSAVYCVLPEFKEYYYSWEELENTVHSLIPHKLQQMRQWLTWESGQPNPPPATIQSELCLICPQQEKCQTFFDVADGNDREAEPPITRSQVEPGNENLEAEPLVQATTDADKIGQELVREAEPPITRSQVEPGNENLEAEPLVQATTDADKIGQELVSTLDSFSIKVDYLGAVVAPAFIRVKLKPHPGVKVVSLLNRSADLQVQLGLAQPPMIAPQAGYVSVDLPRPNHQIAKVEDYIKRQRLPPTAPVKIAIGVNLDGKLVEADLSDANTCHFLVGGTTGSGKSEFLRSLLLSLLYRHSPTQLKIALVDPKRVTFPEFEQIPWLYAPVVKDGESAQALMTDLVAEMESRYYQFETAGCADIGAYNQKAAKSLPRIVCIFDEYADFMAEKEIRNALESSIKRLGAMARAAGIHLIVATQRPEAKVVTPLIRSNLPGRVALRTASEADSTIVLGGNQKAAAYLLGKGDLLYQLGSQLHRLQSLLATTIQLSKSER
ncbi:DNA translocase FtsK [Microseira wollei]|uniref:Cell division FtsK/SpoIIIE n=1 Tax=Microseira wollei NIES-4236 TaxID=2530354 RepID=A0AAV3X6Y9_9CYAN|nr:DNA translocase FtsK [Microseira wollei]GET37071.1 cell division FtsK/SpoIIIE [Microseira wollei NIES-4236]